jgi:hypothetical protein
MAAALVVACAAAACTWPAGKECLAGDYLDCACDDGSRGFQQCSVDATGYSACDCSGATPWVVPLPDAGDDGGDGGDGGLKPFMSTCTTNDECVTNLCFNFPAKGNFCTKPCTPATGLLDCPPPSGSCNNKNVCKAP